MQLTTCQLFSNPQWLYDVTHLPHEDGRMLLKIYVARVVALIVATCLWIVLTLASGLFTVAMVIVIGALVGNAHHLLGSMPRRAHHSSALLLTIVGGIGANVLAGLALFSSKMGIGYWEVLASRRIPEDLQMLFDTFVASFRIEDGFFFVLAVVVTMLSARYLKFFKGT